MYNICIVLLYVQHKNPTQTMTHAHSMVDRCYIYSKLHVHMHTQCNNYESNMYTHTDHRCIWCLYSNDHILRMYMFKVLIQNYTTCEGCMVIDAAGTKYKLNSKECWSNSRQCVWCMYTDCSGLVQHNTH